MTTMPPDTPTAPPTSPAGPGVAASPPPRNAGVQGLPARPFRGIFLKEFREVLPAVAFCWGTATVVLLFMIAIYTEGFTRPLLSQNFIMDEGFLAFFDIGCAAIGFIMGFAPTRSLRTFDQWAFLVHRPITPTRLFFYRTAISVGAYLVVAVLPLALYALWIANNGRATPTFHWRFLLPYAADAQLGLVTLAAGMLVGYRQAKIFATGVLPITAAVAIVAATLAFPEYWQVLAVQAVALAMFGLAAWASAVTHGEHTLRAWPARAALVLTLFVGALLPAFIIDAMAIGWYENNQSERRRFQSTDSWSVVPTLLKNGEVAVSVSRSPSSGPQDRRLYDLQGRPLATEEVMPLVAIAALQDFPAGCFASYGYRDHRSIVKPTGMTETETRLKRVINDFAGENIRDSVFTSPNSANGDDTRWVVLTDKNIHFYDRASVTRNVSLPVLHPTNRNYIIVYRPEGGTDYVVRSVQLYDSMGSTHFDRFDAEGKLIDTRTVDPRQSAFTREMFAKADQSYPLTLDAIVAGTAGGFGMLTVFASALEAVNRYPVPIFAAFRYLWIGVWIVNAWAAVVMIFLARRYDRPWLATLLWTIAALALGPWILVIFVGSHHRPSRIACPNCRRLRPAATETCPACGAGYPEPAKNGTEIFA